MTTTTPLPQTSTDPRPAFAAAVGLLLTTAEDVRRELAGQLTGPVEWTRSVRQMIETGVNTFVEIGPGQVLSRLIKRISRDVHATSLDDGAIAGL
jgi:[acyl-carrier-protein] S-malonyltransferase